MSTLTEADVEAALSWLLSLPFDGYSVSRYYQLHGLFNVPETHPRTPPTRRAPHADVLTGVLPRADPMALPRASQAATAAAQGCQCSQTRGCRAEGMTSPHDPADCEGLTRPEALEWLRHRGLLDGPRTDAGRGAGRFSGPGCSTDTGRSRKTALRAFQGRVKTPIRPQSGMFALIGPSRCGSGPSRSQRPQTIRRPAHPRRRRRAPSPRQARPRRAAEAVLRPHGRGCVRPGPAGARRRQRGRRAGRRPGPGRSSRRCPTMQGP